MRFATTVVGTVLALTLLGVGPVSAFFTVGGSVVFPDTVTVGQTFGASLTISNDSTPPESTNHPVLTISQILVVPACSFPFTDCAGGVDPDAFALGTTGIGTGPPSCGGLWTITEAVPGGYRFTPPGGDGSLQLATGDTCTVTFRASSTRMPQTDWSPFSVGVQTTRVAYYTYSAPGLTPARASGGHLPITVNPAPNPLGVFRPANGFWYLQSGTVTQFGTSGDLPVPADYDGNGTADIAVFRPSMGVWFIQGGPVVQFGTSGDLPVPADYDGNGSADIAVFRPSMGVWFIPGGAAVAFGTSGDIPVPGDYDGDLDDDIAVFRPSSGTWFVLGGQTVAFGASGDIPVPGDYDGNGSTDIAVFRPSNGYWFVRNGITTQFGTTGDIPVPADYDGRGVTEIAVFRPSTGTWFVQGGATTAFGTSGDVPLPLPAAIRTVAFP